MSEVLSVNNVWVLLIMKEKFFILGFDRCDILFKLNNCKNVIKELF